MDTNDTKDLLQYDLTCKFGEDSRFGEIIMEKCEKLESLIVKIRGGSAVLNIINEIINILLFFFVNEVNFPDHINEDFIKRLEQIFYSSDIELSKKIVILLGIIANEPSFVFVSIYKRDFLQKMIDLCLGDFEIMKFGFNFIVSMFSYSNCLDQDIGNELYSTTFPFVIRDLLQGEKIMPCNVLILIAQFCQIVITNKKYCQVFDREYVMCMCKILLEKNNLYSNNYVLRGFSEYCADSVESCMEFVNSDVFLYILNGYENFGLTSKLYILSIVSRVFYLENKEILARIITKGVFRFLLCVFSDGSIESKIIDSLSGSLYLILSLDSRILTQYLTGEILEKMIQAAKHGSTILKLNLRKFLLEYFIYKKTDISNSIVSELLMMYIRVLELDTSNHFLIGSVYKIIYDTYPDLLSLFEETESIEILTRVALDESHPQSEVCSIILSGQVQT